jgi:cell division protein FtsL
MAVSTFRLANPTGYARPVQRPVPPPVQATPPARAVQTRPRELRNTVSLLVAILLISVVGLLYMNEVGRLATSGYQVDTLQQERDRLARENQDLGVQLSQLRAQSRIEQVATQKLHMVKGDVARVQYVQLDPQQLQLAAAPDALSRHG